MYSVLNCDFFSTWLKIFPRLSTTTRGFYACKVTESAVYCSNPYSYQELSFVWKTKWNINANDIVDSWDADLPIYFEEIIYL